MADDKAESNGPRPLRSGGDLKNVIDQQITVSVNHRVRVGKGGTNPKKDITHQYFGNLDGAHDIIDAEFGELDFTVIHFNGMPPVTIDWSIKGQSVFYQVT